MKIVFMGTPEFAVPSLKLLFYSDAIEILAVITQPDRPAGRGNKLQESPVKKFAIENNIKIFQPEKIRKDLVTLNYLKNCPADAFVTVAFGQILSKEILDIPRLGTINLHGSLLPEYRGANPIQWAIINGDTITGATTMLTEEGVDCGDMLLKHEIPILLDDDTITIAVKMANTGSRVLLDTLLGLNEGTIKPEPQNHELATKAPKLNKDSGKINWDNTSYSIHNLIRGTKPWPMAYTHFGGMLLKIHKSSLPPLTDEQKAPAGKIKSISKDIIQVYTGDGYIDIIELQPPNKPVMNAAAWARGARLEAGSSFVSI